MQVFVKGKTAGPGLTRCTLPIRYEALSTQILVKRWPAFADATFILHNSIQQQCQLCVLHKHGLLHVNIARTPQP